PSRRSHVGREQTAPATRSARRWLSGRASSRLVIRIATRLSRSRKRQREIPPQGAHISSAHGLYGLMRPGRDGVSSKCVRMEVGFPGTATGPFAIRVTSLEDVPHRPREAPAAPVIVEYSAMSDLKVTDKRWWVRGEGESAAAEEPRLKPTYLE